MKLPRARHRWNLTPKKAVRLQLRLAPQVRHEPLRRDPRRVAGGDVAFTRDGKHLIAGWVVWDIDAQAVVDTAIALRPVRFPYVPGLLSFREAPALIAAARKLEIEPDAFMFDGQGLAHPRRFGIACNVGLLIDRPSLGCAKSRLCGNADAPAAARGSTQPLLLDGRTLGRVVRTREGVKPVFVSVGHRMTLRDAVRLTLRCCTKYRLPEPTRLAHQLVTSCREDA